MAILPEEIIVKETEKILKERGAWFYKTHGSAFGKSGIPDIIVCYKGRFIGFEVKRHSGGKQSELQKYHQREIHNTDGICEFVRDIDQVLDVLNKIDNE